jgi:hypothetical protein
MAVVLVAVCAVSTSVLARNTCLSTFCNQSIGTLTASHTGCATNEVGQSTVVRRSSAFEKGSKNESQVVAGVLPALAIPVCILFIQSRTPVRAASKTTQGIQPASVTFGNGEMFTRGNGIQVKSAVRAGWTVSFPEKTRSGHFTAKGTLQINPDRNRGEEENVIGALVQDEATGEIFDANEYGKLVVDPKKAYTQNYSENFDLPPGTHRIRFRASYTKSALGEHCLVDMKVPPVAEATQVVFVD